MKEHFGHIFLYRDLCHLAHKQSIQHYCYVAVNIGNLMFDYGMTLQQANDALDFFYVAEYCETRIVEFKPEDDRTFVQVKS